MNGIGQIGQRGQYASGDVGGNDDNQDSKKLSSGAIAGIVIACIIVLIVIIAVPLLLRNKSRPNPPTPPGPGQQCNSTTPCPSGFTCINGSCVANTNPCGANNPCPSGQVCNATTGQCETPAPGPQCSATNPCPPGWVCDPASGRCIQRVPGTCSTGADCTTDPNGKLCCLQNDGSRKCQQCCSDGDCNIANGETCVNGKCVVVPPTPTKCSSNSDCSSSSASKCCNGTCQGCCGNQDCPTGQICNSGTCQVPTNGQGLSVPWIRIKNWWIIPSTDFGGSLGFYNYSDQLPSRLSYTLQGDGNLTTRCAAPNQDPNNVLNSIGQFTFNGSFGNNRTSILNCANNMSFPTCSPNCTDGKTCVWGVCENLAQGGIQVPWIVIGHWLLVPGDITGQLDHLYIVNVNQGSSQLGSYIKLQGDGNVISACSNSTSASNPSLSGALVSGPYFSQCTDASGTGCPSNCGYDPVTKTISNYCLNGQCLPLDPGGLIVPWLQLGSWTIYPAPAQVNPDTRSQLWFENSAQQRASYSFAGDGNIISYCRSTVDGVSKTVSGSLASGPPNGLEPGQIAQCNANPPAPTTGTSCNSNQDCTASGMICIGGTCQAAPTL